VREIYALDSKCQELVFRRGDEGFRACVGSFGSTYLMYGAVVELTDNVLLEMVVTAHDTLEEALLNFPEPDADIDMALVTVGRRQYYLVRFFAASREGQVSDNLRFEGRVGPYIERLIVDAARFLEGIRLKKIMEWAYEKVIMVGWMSTSKKLRNEFMNVNVNAIKKPFKGLFHRHEIWLVEYFVKKEDLQDLVEMYKREYRDIFVFNAAIRFVKAYRETYSTYAERDVYALVICWDQKQDTKSLWRSAARNRRFLEFLKERGGKFYMAYKNEAKDIVSFYPEFAKRVQACESVFSNQMIEGVKKEARASSK